MAALVDVHDDYLSTCVSLLFAGYADGMKEDWKEREVDLARRSFGRRGGFRTRERIRFSGGMGGMKMEGQVCVSGWGGWLADLSNPMAFWVFILFSGSPTHTPASPN